MGRSCYATIRSRFICSFPPHIFWVDDGRWGGYCHTCRFCSRCYVSICWRKRCFLALRCSRCGLVFCSHHEHRCTGPWMAFCRCYIGRFFSVGWAWGGRVTQTTVGCRTSQRRLWIRRVGRLDEHIHCRKFFSSGVLCSHIHSTLSAALVPICWSEHVYHGRHHRGTNFLPCLEHSKIDVHCSHIPYILSFIGLSSQISYILIWK